MAQLGGISACRHLNPERRAAMLEVIGEASKRLFDDVYGADNHLELMQLNTHPDYMRHGYGSALVRWGISLAKKEHLTAVSVSANWMGALLYAHLGFRYLEQLVIQVPGETETATVDLLTLELWSYKQRLGKGESSQAANGF